MPKALHNLDMGGSKIISVADPTSAQDAATKAYADTKLANPMTTLGDTIYGAAAGAATRLGAGSNGQVLKLAAGIPSWAADTGFDNPMTTIEDLIKGGAAGVPARLGVGSSGQVLSVVGGAVAWAAPSDRIRIRKNSTGADFGPYGRVNLIEDTGIAWTIFDDAVNNEIDVSARIRKSSIGSLYLSDLITVNVPNGYMTEPDADDPTIPAKWVLTQEDAGITHDLDVADATFANGALIINLPATPGQKIVWESSVVPIMTGAIKAQNQVFAAVVHRATVASGTLEVTLHNVDQNGNYLFFFADLFSAATPSTSSPGTRTKGRFSPGNAAGVFLRVEATAGASATTIYLTGFELRPSVETPELASIPGFVDGTFNSVTVDTNGLVSAGTNGRILITGGATGTIPLEVDAPGGQTANLLEIAVGAVDRLTLTPAGLLTDILKDAITAAVTDILTLGHNSTGTPAASFGTGLLFLGETTTTEDQNMARIAAVWSTATHASRAAGLSFQTVNAAGALTERMLLSSGGALTVAGTLTASGTGTHTIAGLLNVSRGATITSNVASTVPLTIKHAASPTAPFFRVQDSAAVNVWAILSDAMLQRNAGPALIDMVGDTEGGVRLTLRNNVDDQGVRFDAFPTGTKDFVDFVFGYPAGDAKMRLEGTVGSTMTDQTEEWQLSGTGGTSIVFAASARAVWLPVSSSVPPTPASGATIYVDPADDKTKIKGSSGTVTVLALP